MNTSRFAVLVAALLAAPTALASEQDFGWFGDLVGSCWTGTFADGKTVHTQCYTSQFGKFVRGTASLRPASAASPSFEGDSVFAWDREARKIAYYIWGSDGSHRRLEAFYKGDELVFPVTSRANPEVIAFQSVWRRLGPDEFEARRERPNGNEWNTELTVRYRRSAAAAPTR